IKAWCASSIPSRVPPSRTTIAEPMKSSHALLRRVKCSLVAPHGEGDAPCGSRSATGRPMRLTSTVRWMRPDGHSETLRLECSLDARRTQKGPKQERAHWQLAVLGGDILARVARAPTVKFCTPLKLDAAMTRSCDHTGRSHRSCDRTGSCRTPRCLLAELKPPHQKRDRLGAGLAIFGYRLIGGALQELACRLASVKLHDDELIACPLAFEHDRRFIGGKQLAARARKGVGEPALIASIGGLIGKAQLGNDVGAHPSSLRA